jgi:hypothetical protein
LTGDLLGEVPEVEDKGRLNVDSEEEGFSLLRERLGHLMLPLPREEEEDDDGVASGEAIGSLLVL